MFDFSGYVFYHRGDGGAQSSSPSFSAFSVVIFFHHRGHGGSQRFFLRCCFFTTEGTEGHRVLLRVSLRSQWLYFFTTEGTEGHRGFFYVNLLRKIKDLSRFIQ